MSGKSTMEEMTVEEYQAFLASKRDKRKPAPKVCVETLPGAIWKMTELEYQFWKMVEMAGLPLPSAHEYYFNRGDTRHKSDFAYPGFRILIECEGGIWGEGEEAGRHVRGKGYSDDCFKYNLAQILGWIVLRFTPDQIEDGRAVAQLERILTIKIQEQDDKWRHRK